jgi:hypothetical protein
MFGKHPASPAPKRNRAAIMENRVLALAVAAVKKEHHITTRSSTFFGPKRSPSHPPGISNRAHASVKAPNTWPASTSEKRRSRWMKGIAFEMQTRSMYWMTARVTAKTTTQ